MLIHIPHTDACWPSSIAAASVIAKEARDEFIHQLAKQFPGYGLDTNVGYGTQVHRDAIIKKGITEFHRKSFLSKVLNQQGK